MSLADILMRSGAAGAGLPKRFQPLLAQALNEAAVRYSPQYDALNQLRQQSAQTMRQSIGQANSAGQLNAALALEAHKAIAGDSGPAIQQALAYQNAPPGSSTQRVGLGLALGHDATANILAQSAADAPIVAAQQGLQARALHQQDLQKIQGQRDSILGQVGTYVTGREGDLVTADRKQRATLNQNLRTIKAAQTRADTSAATARRGQDLSHQDRQAAIQQRRDAAATKKATQKTADVFQQKYGVKPATSVQMTQAKNKIGYALSIAKTHKGQGDARNLVAQILVNGQPSFKDPKTGAPIPGIKSVDPVWASVALDVAYDGHISQKNAAQLHKLGYSVESLGIPSRPPRTPRPKPGGITGNLVAQLPS